MSRRRPQAVERLGRQRQSADSWSSTRGWQDLRQLIKCVRQLPAPARRWPQERPGRTSRSTRRSQGAGREETGRLRTPLPRRSHRSSNRRSLGAAIALPNEPSRRRSQGGSTEMKKLTVVLSAVMVLALALPAAAAPAFTIGGSVEQEFRLERGENDDMRLRGYTGLDLEAARSDEDGDPIRAVIEFAPWSWNNLGEDDELVEDIANPYPGQATGLEIDKIYLEAQGALWNGGPEMTTTIGDVEIEHSPWVASLDRRGAKVENLGIGPVTVAGFYGWAERDAQGQAENPAYGLSLAGNLANVGLSTSVVRQDEATELAASAVTQIGPAIVHGTVALDENQNQAFDVNAETAVMPNLNLHLGYRGGDEEFMPRFADVDTLEDEGQASWARDADDNPAQLQRGIEVGIGTVQYGTQIVASYDQPT